LGLAARREPATVIWIRHKDGVQFNLDLNLLSKDLAYAGVRLMVVSDSVEAMRAATSLGPALRCVIQNWRRSSPDSGREFIERLQSLCGKHQRHVPVLVLSHTVLGSRELQEEVRLVGEEPALFDPAASPQGFARLVEWIFRRCVGIENSVTFVRHAEAEHNATGDWNIPDPDLTPKGEQQARSLAAERPPEVATAQVLLTSPLRRTLQTTLLAFGTAGLPVVCESLIQEGGGAACDTGSDKASLRQWFAGTGLNFEGLHDQWYMKEGINEVARLNERMMRLTGFIRQRSETELVVVAHGIVLRELLGLEKERSAVGLSWENSGGFENCECRRYWLLSSGTWLAAPDPRIAPPLNGAGGGDLQKKPKLGACG